MNETRMKESNCHERKKTSKNEQRKDQKPAKSKQAWVIKIRK